MPTIDLHLRPSSTPSRLTPTPPKHETDNPLPPLLHTPLGLAILEIQGTLNIPAPETADSSSNAGKHTHDVPSNGDYSALETAVGKLYFPLLSQQGASGEHEGAWMKKVYLYVGASQRLAGEVKKLARPIAVIARRSGLVEDGARTMDGMDVDTDGEQAEELEVLEIVRWKLFFGGRPEFV